MRKCTLVQVRLDTLNFTNVILSIGNWIALLAASGVEVHLQMVGRRRSSIKDRLCGL